MPQRVVVVHLWQVVLAFIAVTTAFVIQGILLTQTINDVNHDRVVSCERTYEGVREIFKPFFTPLDTQTPKQRRDIAKFNRRIETLKSRCGIQTGTKGTA